MRRLRSLTRLLSNDREGGRRPPSRCRVLVAAALLIGFALAGCTGDDQDAQETAAATAPAATTPRSGGLTVVERGDVDVAWAMGDTLQLEGGAPQELADSVNATLIANLAPIAVPGPEGDAVAYNSWRGTRPVLRIRDVGTRKESVLDEGAHSVAWAADGMLAYFKAQKPDLGDPRRYLGHVVVRQSRIAGARPWTLQPGRYVVAAWAARRVLFYRLGTSFPDLLVLDRPQRQRVLARGSALVAVSPDGRHAFASRYGASPPLVRVFDVASGAEVARLRVDANGVKHVVEAGSWAGDLVFAPTTTGVVVFRIADGAITIEQVLRAQPEFPTGLSEPRAAVGGRTFVAWGALEAQPRQAVQQAAVVECDRTTLLCVRAAVGSAVAPPRPIHNPSRP